MDIKEKLNLIFREVFDDDEIAVSRETTADDVEGWDSLSHVNLILAVEEGFNIHFDDEELMNFENVGDMIDAIGAKIK